MRNRYVLEGEWSGYSSRQRRIVHREVVRKPVTLSCIQFGDGTTLDITVRPATKGERVKVVLGYRELIHDALMLDKAFVTVDELAPKRSA